MIFGNPSFLTTLPFVKFPLPLIAQYQQEKFTDNHKSGKFPYEPSRASHKVLVTLTLYNAIPISNNAKRERSLLKTLWEKEEMLVTSIFSFSNNVFSPIKDMNHHFSNYEYVMCKCFQFGPIQMQMLLIATAVNLDKAKILLSSRKLSILPTLRNKVLQ